MAKTDWEAIKAEYCAGGISQQALALEHDVSYRALRERAQKEKWTELRQEAGKKTAEKLTEAISDAKIEKIKKIVDQLLAQAMTASKQLTKRPKQIRESEDLGDGMWRVTVRTEYENGTVVDKAGLNMLAKTVQNLDDILRKQRQDTQGGESKEIRVIFDPYEDDDA